MTFDLLYAIAALWVAMGIAFWIATVFHPGHGWPLDVRDVIMDFSMIFVCAALGPLPWFLRRFDLDER